MSKLADLTKKLAATSKKAAKASYDLVKEPSSAVALDALNVMTEGVSDALMNIREQMQPKNLINAMLPKPLALLAMRVFTSKRKSSKTEEEVSKEKLKNEKSIGGSSITPIDGSQDAVDGQDDVFDALLEAQEESIDLLNKIVENTTPDRLKEREDEIEKRKAAQLANRDSVNPGELAKDTNKTQGILSKILGGGVGELVAGWLGLKGAKGTVKGVLGGLLGKGKSLGSAALSGLGKAIKPLAGVAGIAAIGSLFASSPAEIKSKIDPAEIGKKSLAEKSSNVKDAAVTKNTSVFKTVSEAAKNATSNTIGKLKSVTGPTAAAVVSTIEDAKVIDKGKALVSKALGVVSDAKSGATNAFTTAASYGSKATKFVGNMLGRAATPLMVGASGLEAYNVSQNDSITQSEKNVEYTTIGSKLAGMLAGAKVGATAGGAIGAGFGGVGAVPGAIIGGIGGAFAGESAGEWLGEKIGKVLFSDSKSTEKAIEREKLKADTSFNSSSVSSSEFTSERIGTANALVNSPNTNNASTVNHIASYLQNSPEVPYSITKYLNGNSTEKYFDIQPLLLQHLSSIGIQATPSIAVASVMKAKNEIADKLIKVDQVKAVSQTKPSVKDLSPSNSLKATVVSPPSIGNIDVGESKVQAAKAAAFGMDEIRHERESLLMRPPPPVVIQSNGSGQQANQLNNDLGSRRRLGVPNVRSQDNTLQRLLDKTFKPIFD